MLPHLGLRADDDGLDGAPVPFALAVHVIDAAEFPLGEGGGEGGGIDVVRGGVHDEGDPAGSTIHLEFAGVQPIRIAAPAPGDEDLSVEDGDFEFRGQGGPVRAAGLAADDAEVRPDLWGEAGIILDLLHGGEDAVQGSFLYGNHGGEAAGGEIGCRRVGRDEGREDEEFIIGGTLGQL